MTSPTIDLKLTRQVLEEALALVNTIDGEELDERDGWQDKAKAREEKLAKSRTLQVIAHRCAMAEQLTLNEYWIARGVGDAIEAP